MVEPEQMQHRRMEVMHVNRVLDSAITKLVRGALHMAAFDATARQPNREAVMIVIAAFALSRRARSRDLN